MRIIFSSGPRRLLPKMILTPKLTRDPELFWCVSVVSASHKPVRHWGQWSRDFCLPGVPGIKDCTLWTHKGLLKVSFRFLAYSTSFQRLDGTVARAKSGVLWNIWEAKRKQSRGLWDIPLLGLIQTHCWNVGGLLPAWHRVLGHVLSTFTHMASCWPTCGPLRRAVLDVILWNYNSEKTSA